MANSLKNKEDELRVYLSRIDDEIVKFHETERDVAGSKEKLVEVLQDKGFGGIPVKISSSNSKELLTEVRDHLLSLEKLRNFISQKLAKIVQQKELVQKLEGTFGEEVSVGVNEDGRVEVNFNNSDTKKIASSVKKSKDLVEDIRNSVTKSLTE